VFFFESPKVFAKKSQIILLISSIVCKFGFAELTSAYYYFVCFFVNLASPNLLPLDKKKKDFSFTLIYFENL
jgi:hypothetical protein